MESKTSLQIGSTTMSRKVRTKLQRLNFKRGEIGPTYNMCVTNRKSEILENEKQEEMYDKVTKRMLKNYS